MKRNVGVKDKSIRMLMAIAFALAAATDYFPMVMNYVLIALAAILIITGFARVCPIYKALGYNTSENNKGSGKE